MTNDKGEKQALNTLPVGDQLTAYEIPSIEGGIKLAHDEMVWGPYSAGYFLGVLNQNGIFERFNGISLLDLGSGSGVLGIAALTKGSTFVTMSDISPNAVALSARNAALNGFEEGCRFEAVHSDAFVNIPGVYHMIISNPPVQPELAGVHADKPAYKSNESGTNGRRALDQIIREGRQHLYPNGQMIFSSSSRHGHQLTTRMMDRYWGEGNWSIINSDEHGQGKEETIIPEYHGPYMMYWVGLQMMDMDFRVYQKDADGLPLCETQLTEERGVKLITIPSPNGNKTVKLDIFSGRVIRAVELVDQFENQIELPAEFVIPQVGEDKNWYYKYYVIEANSAVETVTADEVRES